MKTGLRWFASLSLVLLLVSDRSASADPMSETQLAAKIDQLIATRLKKEKVTPAPNASDSEFVRRVYLDLAGRIPRVSEVRAFLADKSPDKRRRLINKLLNGRPFITHFTNVWTDTLLPPTNDRRLQFLATGFRSWVEQQIEQQVPYDKMVRALLTPSAVLRKDGQVARYYRPGGSSPLAFFQANENKPENLAASTARLFLGVRLECAQCHDHPFADWSREQFWGLAAFFANIRSNTIRQRAQVNPQPVPKNPTREIKIAGTERIVQATFLDGTNPKFDNQADSSVVLADWVTSAKNPYFARTAANRIWHYLFGIGLIDPVDELPAVDNPCSHPELMKLLTQQYIASDFDMRYLVRAITLTKTYQRTSKQTHPSQKNPRLFARMSVKGLSGEQLFDSLAIATGYRDPTPFNQRRFVVARTNTARGKFLANFSSNDKRTETQTSILQALALMNGEFISDATSIERSTTLAAVADAPFMSTKERIRTLFLATLSRQPRPQEEQQLVDYVERGGAAKDRKKALADVFWALLNTSEFILNH